MGIVARSDMLVYYSKRYCYSRVKAVWIIIMTPDGYKEKGIIPTVGSVIWSPHASIFKRGYPFTYKVLDVKKIKGRLLLTVEKKAPSKKIISKSEKIWFDEID